MASGVLTIGVYVLAQQGHLFIAGGCKPSDLTAYILRLPAPLTAPRMGDDAIGAEFITPVDNIYIGLYRVVPQHWKIGGKTTDLFHRCGRPLSPPLCGHCTLSLPLLFFKELRNL